MNTNSLPGTASQSATNILLVDDEPNVLKALCRVLRNPHYHLQTADNGVNALALMEQHSFDLIISDMRMPQMDGAEFLRHAAKRWPDTMRMLLTGYADIESTIAAVNDGQIFCYCCKPWDDDDLRTRVHFALEQKRAREERARLFDIINSKNKELEELNASLEEKVEKRTAQVKKSLSMVDQAHNELKKQYTESIKVFAKIIEMRPGIKSGHAKYIAENARRVAACLQLEADEIKNIVFAALLLQLGKISLTDSLLNTPINQMNRQQHKAFLNHAIEGHDLLTGIDPLKTAADFIRLQYENYDGKGFPLGLVGKEIPVGSRILAVVRDYLNYLDGAITGERMTAPQAKDMLTSRSGSCYDPLVVETFLQVLQETETMEARPIIEVAWNQLRPGMEAAEILVNDTVFLKDHIVTENHVLAIMNLKHSGCKLVLRIRTGSELTH